MYAVLHNIFAWCNNFKKITSVTTPIKYYPFKALSKFLWSLWCVADVCLIYKAGQDATFKLNSEPCRHANLKGAFTWSCRENIDQITVIIEELVY